MLQLTISGGENWNSVTEEFESYPEVTLQLEHSLISISKWESKWQKSFLSTREITPEQFRDYVRCMTLNRQVDPNVYDRLNGLHERLVRAYIENPMSATTVRHDDKRSHFRIITSEQIYGWMIAYGIPFDPCEKWHLNRLLKLIEVCGAQQTSRKMTPKERANAQRAQKARMRGRK